MIGAGLAGASTASALARAGFSVAIVDAHAVRPPEYRAEKMGGTELTLLDRFGLDAAARSIATPLDSVWLARFGRLVSVCDNDEQGFAYADLINALRAALPGSVAQFVGRIAAIRTSADRQGVTLTDGTAIEARLIVVATGLGDVVRRMLGVDTVCEDRCFSLSLGLTMQAPGEAFPFRHLVYHGERVADRVAYLSLFRIGAIMRGNLFVYRSLDDPWVTRFRRDPEAVLGTTLRHLGAFCSDLALAGKTDVRPTDLVRVDGHVRDGVVFVGDAFRTTCPVAGRGMNKALTDVDRLCAYVPGWLESPGMAAAKVANFYDDPAKRACDADSLAVSRHTRDFTVGQSWPWPARRARSAIYRRAQVELRLARRGLTRLRPADPDFPVGRARNC